MCIVLNSSLNIFVKPMVSPYPFQNEISNVTPKLNKIDKSKCVNVIKDIAIQLVEFELKMEEEYIVVNLINTLIMQKMFDLPSLVI